MLISLDLFRTVCEFVVRLKQRKLMRLKLAAVSLANRCKLMSGKGWRDRALLEELPRGATIQVDFDE